LVEIPRASETGSFLFDVQPTLHLINKLRSTRGTKTAKLLALLKRPCGATAKDLMKATDWQAHSVRGFLSGTLEKKMGLAVESTRRENGERQYKIKR
jgi:uncharacterized protein DUF3489